MQGDSAMNPQHIRGDKVNAALSPQYAKGLSTPAFGERRLAPPLGTRPGVTLSWTSVQGSAPMYPILQTVIDYANM